MIRLVIVTAAALVMVAGSVFADDNTPAAGKKKFAGKGGTEMIFKKLDENKDGKLSKDEFKKVSELRKKAGAGEAEKAKERSEKMFDKLDENSDGYLSADEFKKIGEMRKKD